MKELQTKIAMGYPAISVRVTIIKRQKYGYGKKELLDTASVNDY